MNGFGQRVSTPVHGAPASGSWRGVEVVLRTKNEWRRWGWPGSPCRCGPAQRDRALVASSRPLRSCRSCRRRPQTARPLASRRSSSFLTMEVSARRPTGVDAEHGVEGAGGAEHALAGAEGGGAVGRGCQLYQTDLPPGLLSGEWLGSPASFVAPELTPVTRPAGPVSACAAEKLSLAGAGTAPTV